MRSQDRRRNSFRVPLVTIAAICLWCTGCSDTSAPRPAVSEAGTREISIAERGKLHQAEQLLIQKCMDRYGFKTWPTPEQSSLPGSVDFPYVITDEAWARQHGYGSDIHQSIVRMKQSDPNQRYFAKLSPEKRAAALTALNGAEPVGLEARMPTGGVLRRSDRSCVSEAESALYGDLRMWYRVKKVTDSLGSLRTGRVLEDRRFKKAVQPWALCMRKSGYTYSTPNEARTAALRGIGGRGGRAEEVRTAITEARCANETGLAAITRRLDRQYKAAIEKQYSSDFKTRRTMESDALPRAIEVTAEK